jgi:tetratricopeptide (TPR) repeat protein
MAPMSDSSATFLPEQPAVDLQHPWPGLSAFTEELHEFFHGRDREADDLFRRVRRKAFTVLFGQSGLGKTSLLQAGLFPMLRREGFLPVLIRIDYATTAPAPAAQVKAAVVHALESADLAGATRPKPEETLWEYFHRTDVCLEIREDEPFSLALVFDQFEELFTLGQAGAAAHSRLPAFLSELADLIEDRAPAVLRQRFKDNPELVGDFAYNRQNYRVLFCLREDYLAHLEDLRERMPSIAQNRMRLTGMNGPQALKAVLGPGEGLVSEEVGRQIVRFVAGSPGRKSTPGHVQGDADGLEGCEVEPSLLSLVCRELNDRRLGQGLPQITADLLAGSSERILQDFYERCVGDQPPAVRAFIEEELLTDSGARENMALERARKELRERGAPPSAVNELVKRRLLHLEERLGVQRVELTHDVLTDVVKKSRDKRQQEEAASRAVEREREVRRQLRRSRKRLAYMMGLVVFFAGVSGIAVYFMLVAEQATKVAQEQKKETQATMARLKLSEKENTEKTLLVVSLQKRNSVSEATQERIQDFESTLYTQSTNNPALLALLPQALEIDTQHLDEMLKVDPQDVKALQKKALKLAQSADLAEKRKKPDDAIRLCEQGLKAAGTLSTKINDVASLRHALLAYGIIAGTYKALGKLPDAMEACDNAISIAEKVDPTKESRATYYRSVLYALRGEIFRAQKRNSDALDAYRSGLKVAEEAAGDNDDPKLRGQTASIHAATGNILLDQGKKEDALASFKKARDIRVALWRANDGFETRRNLALSFEKIGDVYKALGNYEEARTAYDNNLRARKGMISETPSKVPPELAYNIDEAKYDLSFAYRRIGNLELTLGNPWDAKEAFWLSRDIAEELVQRNPAVKYLQELSYAYNGLGNSTRKQGQLALPVFGAAIVGLISSSMGQGLFLPTSALIPQKTKIMRFKEARDYYLKGLNAIDKAAKREPENDGLQDDLAFSYGKLGSTDIDLGKIPEAVDAYGRAVEISRSLAKKKDSDESRHALAGDLGSLAYAEIFNSQFQEAIANAKEALTIDPTQVWIQTNLAHGYLFDGRYEEAKAIYLKFKDVKVPGEQTFAESVLDDFRRFREQGVTHPDMEKIERLLKKSP